MIIKNTAILSALFLCSPIQAFAHEGAAHKGNAIHGTVTSVGADGFEVKTGDGPMSVKFSDKTVFEHGGKPATSAHLKAGEAVEIHGMKLPGGKLGAEEVLIGTHSGAGHSDHEGNEPQGQTADSH